MLQTKPKVLPAHRKLSDGTLKENWLVYAGTDGGRGVKHYRSNKSDALALAKQLGEKVKRVGDAASLLSAAQTYDAAEAFTMLSDAGAGITLTECARQWLERNRDSLQCQTLSVKDCLDAYLSRFDKNKEHFYSSKNSLTRLITPFGDMRPMAQLDRTAVEAFLRSYDNPKSFNLNRGYVLAFLNWARKNGKYTSVQYDSCLCVERKPEPYRPPPFFHADTVEKVMRWCESQPDADMLVPKFAIGFFAGVRSDEIARMDWKDVHLADKEIRIETPKGKTGTPPRIVSMSDNLAAWLQKFWRESGKLCYCETVITARKKILREETGVDFDSKDMRNIARHTFATMHAAHHRNYELTAAEMGHGQSTTMLMKHYKSITGKADAEAFWKIMPKED